MKRRVLIDTGPLVAMLNRKDRYHAWSKAQIANIEPPLLTCEAVLSEACFLLQRISQGPQTVFKLLQQDLLAVAFQLDREFLQVAALIKRYANVPMSLADACLVRMVELHAQSELLTLDSDFQVYRQNNRQIIPTIIPPGI